MELPMRLKGANQKKRSKKVKDLLNIVGLKNLEDRYPSQLSRGQRQRIAAVRSFVNNPKMILADEPNSDLDPENAGILLNFLRTLNKDAEITVIIASTNKEDFNKITSRNLRIENGRIV
jgi:ABC-type methionine transport system ATPase subunit